MMEIRPELYEVVVVPHDPDLRKDFDLRVHTFGKDPESAIRKVRGYLEDTNHVCFRWALGFDYVVHRRLLLE